MNEFSENIGKKIEVSITVMIFLTVVIKAFLELSRPSEEVNMVFIASSVLVGFYIISYGMYYFLKNKILGTRGSEKIMNFGLNLNFILIGIVSIIILFGISNPLPNYVNFIIYGLFVFSFVFVFLFPLILVLIFWIDILFFDKVNYLKLNKNISKIPKQIEFKKSLRYKVKKENNKIGEFSFRKIEIYLALIMVLLTVINIYYYKELTQKSLNLTQEALEISEKQADISETQTELLKISSQPYEAHIEYLQENQDWKIPFNQFTLAKPIDGNEYLQKPNSRLRLYNLGRIDTQYIRCQQDLFSDNNFNIQFANEYLNYTSENSLLFSNIMSGTANETGFFIFDRKCAYNLANCTMYDNNISLGEQNIKLNCDCYWCKEQNKFTINISFCVYSNITKDCPVNNN